MNVKTIEELVEVRRETVRSLSNAVHAAEMDLRDLRAGLEHADQLLREAEATAKAEKEES